MWMYVGCLCLCLQYSKGQRQRFAWSFFCQAADFMGSASASEAFGEPGSKVAALPLFLSGLSLAVPWAVLDHAGTECIISVCLLNDSGTEKETETKSGVLAQKEL